MNVFDENKILYSNDASMVVGMKPSGHRRAVRWLLAITGLMFALLLGLLSIFFVGAELFEKNQQGGLIALLLGLLFATLPVPLYALLIIWIDRYESEPLHLLGIAFLWGATVAAFSAGIVNSLSILVVNEAFGATVSAPIVEESMKALALFALYFWKKDEFDDVIDGIVYAGMIALGFAMTENIRYYGLGALEGHLGGLFILRGIVSPFSHPLFTSMTGIGLGLARQSNNRLVKFCAPLLGLLVAMLMHATWNSSAVFFGGVGFLLVYFLLMVPAFVAALVAIYFALRREGRIVREHLLCDFQRGLFTSEDYNRLCSVRGRMSASLNSLARGGIGKWRARMQYHQTASELAFHRSRIARGLESNRQTAAEREAAYLQHLYALNKHLTADR
jgi:RsiW-degrading membrane proteinase PrsW (M82 family)